MIDLIPTAYLIAMLAVVFAAIVKLDRPQLRPPTLGREAVRKIVFGGVA